MWNNPNSWAIGVYYRYNTVYNPPGNVLSDFAVHTGNYGFYSSGSNGVDYVLTDSVNGWAPQIAAQFSPSDAGCLNDQIWQLGQSSPAFNTCHSASVEGVITIETKITYSSYYGTYFVNWYLNGKWYNSWAVNQSYFDTEMNPSFVLESADTNSNDFSLNWASGVFYQSGSSIHTHFYGGVWCVIQSACFQQDLDQSSSYFIGTNTNAPYYNVATAGYAYNNNNGMFVPYEFGIGYAGDFPTSPNPISDYVAKAYAGGNIDPSTFQMS
jgi:hypothetical protein